MGEAMNAGSRRCPNWRARSSSPPAYPPGMRPKVASFASKWALSRPPRRRMFISKTFALTSRSKLSCGSAPGLQRRPALCCGYRAGMPDSVGMSQHNSTECAICKSSGGRVLTFCSSQFTLASKLARSPSTASVLSASIKVSAQPEYPVLL